MNLSTFIAALRADLERPDRTWTNPKDGREMIVIPAGASRLGVSRRRVHQPAFSVSRHPVTNAEFHRFVSETGYTPHEVRGERGAPLALLAHLGGQPPRPSEADQPAVWVSLLDARAYCDWAGLVVPTPEMWERAARGADGRTFPWGEQRPSSRLATIASRQRSAVGAHPTVRTATGCEDMIGNISEWCHPGADPRDAIDPDATRYAQVRGSAYLRSPDHTRMACAYVRRLSVTRRNKWVGLRPAALAHSAPGAEKSD